MLSDVILVINRCEIKKSSQLVLVISHFGPYRQIKITVSNHYQRPKLNKLSLSGVKVTND